MDSGDFIILIIVIFRLFPAFPLEFMDTQMLPLAMWH